MKCAILGLSLLATSLMGADSLAPFTQADQIPQSAPALWSSFDPRADALEVKVHKEWKAEGVVSRLISFKVGTFKGEDARLAAYYCFPDNGKKNPGFVYSHGGGQRADRQRGHYFATQGFATIDINWLGRPLEPELDPDNKWGTDWGKIDPTQGPGFYKKALRKQFKRSFAADEFTVDPIMSPRNSNWFMLSLAGRRALTFLEQQAEVDPEKLGFTGFSMGGTITSMTSIDKRLKAVAPFVGGTAGLHNNFPGMETGNMVRGIKDVELYANTIDPGAYWKHVKVPVMFITSSNDFHSAFERIYDSMALIPHGKWRVTGNIHANHGPGPEQWVMLTRWFKQYLAGQNQNIPATASSSFSIKGNTATFSVTPDQAENLKDIEIYYSYDPNSITRFWKRANSVTKSDKSYSTTIPVHHKLPVFTFALCRYQLAHEEKLERGSTSTFSINSKEHRHIPKDLDLSYLTKLTKSGLIDDFSNGTQNWSTRGHGSFKSYKFQDPELDTRSENKLVLTFDLPKDKSILVGLGAGSKFLGPGRSQARFHYGTRVNTAGESTLTLERKDFKTNDKNKAFSWANIVDFSINLTDEKTKQKIDLSDAEQRSVLKRIELVAP